MPPSPDARASAKHELEPDVGFRVGVRAGENVERQREQPVARQDGGGLVERLMSGRSAAPQVVVVHRRQVVVRQRIAVHTFERAPRQQGALAHHAEQRGALHHQERPEALAAAEADIPHRIKQPRRARKFPFDRARAQQSVQQNLDIAGHLREAVLEHRFDVDAFLHWFTTGHIHPPGGAAFYQEGNPRPTFPTPVHCLC